MKSENMATQTIVVDGKPYVLLPRDEYDRLTTLAKAADLPPLPESDAQGNYPAVEYRRIRPCQSGPQDYPRPRGRRADATRAGETGGNQFRASARIETGKQVPSVPTIDKIDRALKRAGKAANKPVKKGR